MYSFLLWPKGDASKRKPSQACALDAMFVFHAFVHNFAWRCQFDEGIESSAYSNSFARPFIAGTLSAFGWIDPKQKQSFIHQRHEQPLFGYISFTDQRATKVAIQTRVFPCNGCFRCAFGEVPRILRQRFLDTIYRHSICRTKIYEQGSKNVSE